MALPIMNTEERATGFIKPYVAKLLFTPEECRRLVEEVTLNVSPKREFIAGEGGKNSTSRAIYMDEYSWAYEKVYDFILEANKNNFGFSEDFVLNKPMTVNEYKGSEYCGWHTDGFISDGSEYLYRKLTCVVQLSDPSEYEGGNFELFAYHAIKEDIKPIGMAYIIPSFEWHQVTPITKGTRRSLIMFLDGKDRFR